MARLAWLEGTQVLPVFFQCHPTIRKILRVHGTRNTKIVITHLKSLIESIKQPVLTTQTANIHEKSTILVLELGC